MKRFVLVVLIATPLLSSISSCKAAHHAGNDSMRSPGGNISAIQHPHGNAHAIDAAKLQAAPVEQPKVASS